MEANIIDGCLFEENEGESVGFTIIHTSLNISNSTFRNNKAKFKSANILISLGSLFITNSHFINSIDTKYQFRRIILETSL